MVVCEGDRQRVQPDVVAVENDATGAGLTTTLIVVSSEQFAVGGGEQHSIGSAGGVQMERLCGC